VYVDKDDEHEEDGRGDGRIGDRTWRTASRSVRSEEGKSWETVAWDE
jgi:hypothetical protein